MGTTWPMEGKPALISTDSVLNLKLLDSRLVNIFPGLPIQLLYIDDDTMSFCVFSEQ